MKPSEESANPEATNYLPAPKPEGRFNNWGERKWITVSPEKRDAVEKELSQLKLSSRAQALYRAAKFTDSTGLEFVFISNAQFPTSVIFKTSGIHIVPCFTPLKLAHGAASEDRQMAMMKRGIFIYDGWVFIHSWTKDNLEQVISSLDDLVNVFSIVGKYHADWMPKYYFSETSIPSHLIFPGEFSALSQSVGVVDTLPTADRIAVSRSAAWIATALRDESPIQRFLLLFVSIEALATYIEKESEASSPLRIFGGDKLDKSEKKKQREACISSVMASGLEMTKAIQKAYFECVVGSRKLLEQHLRRVFQNEQPGMVLFNETTDGKSLWDLRNEIAHGNLNVLSDTEMQVIITRASALEEIARSYIRRILSHIAKVDYFPTTHSPILTLPASNAIGMTGTQYMGPTDMAEYYLGVKAIGSSFVRVTF